MSETYFWTVVLEKTIESPLDCREIKSVNPKGNRSWIFIGRTNADARILWPPDAKNQLIGKDPDAGKDWRQEEKGTTEDETVGWHHRLNGHEFEHEFPELVMDPEAWRAAVHGVAKSQIRSDWTELMSETWLSGWEQWRKFLSSPEVMGLSPHLLLTLNIMGPLFFSLWVFKKISVWITSKVYRLKWNDLSFCSCWDLQLYHSPSASSKGHHKKLVSEARCHICLKAVAEIILHRSTTLLIVS